MSSDATTLPLRGDGARELSGGHLHRRLGRRVRDGALAPTGTLVAALALAGIVALSLFVVLMAANQPSLLTPTTHSGYFPRWMAGPLGGLLGNGFTGNGTTLKYLFSGAIAAMYLAYLLVLKGSRLQARWVIAAIVAVHAVFFLSPPLALTDLFNYVNYGRMEVVHNLNPYTTIPILEPHNDPSYILSNWHELLSPYGPLFTLLTFAVVPLGVAGSFWVLKGLLALTSLGIVALVWKSARILGRNPVTAAALVGLNPIVLVWGLGGDHNDFLMMFFIMLGFYLLLVSWREYGENAAHGGAGAGGAGAGAEAGVGAGAEAKAGAGAEAKAGAGAEAKAGAGAEAGAGRWRLRRLLAPWRSWLSPLSTRELCAGAAFVAAVAMKASGGVLLPVVLVGLLRRPRMLVQVLLGMIAGSIVLGAASLLAFGLHIPDLSTQGSLVTSESIPNLIGLAIGLGGESTGLRELLSVVLIASILTCCWLVWRGRLDSLTASGWASVALLVTLSWVLPWYVLWVLPLAALSRSRRLRGAAIVVGVYLIVVWAPASGRLWDALHFEPAKTPLGRLHQRYVKELLD